VPDRDVCDLCREALAGRLWHRGDIAGARICGRCLQLRKLRRRLPEPTEAEWDLFFEGDDEAFAQYQQRTGRSEREAWFAFGRDPDLAKNPTGADMSYSIEISDVEIKVGKSKLNVRGDHTRTVSTPLDIGGFKAKLLQSTYPNGDSLSTLTSWEIRDAIREATGEEDEYGGQEIIAETSLIAPMFGLEAALHLLYETVGLLIEADAL